MPAPHGMLGLGESEGLWRRMTGPRTQLDPMAALEELRLWGASKGLDPAVAASEAKPPAPAWPQPPGGGQPRAEGAQAEPEQSPAGRQAVGGSWAAGWKQPGLW